jgi:hypothetical protein
MPERVVRETDRFECEDETGSQYVVVELQHYSIWKPMSGPLEEKPTVKEYRLLDGRDVEIVSEGTFKIIATDEIIREI